MHLPSWPTSVHATSVYKPCSSSGRRLPRRRLDWVQSQRSWWPFQWQVGCSWRQGRGARLSFRSGTPCPCRSARRRTADPGRKRLPRPDPLWPWNTAFQSPSGFLEQPSQGSGWRGSPSGLWRVSRRNAATRVRRTQRWRTTDLHRISYHLFTNLKRNQQFVSKFHVFSMGCWDCRRCPPPFHPGAGLAPPERTAVACTSIGLISFQLLTLKEYFGQSRIIIFNESWDYD